MYESNIAHEKHERVILFTRSREQLLGVQFQGYCEKLNKNKSINKKYFIIVDVMSQL